MINGKKDAAFPARALKEGEAIAVVAPSSPFDETLLEKGISCLENFGFKVNYTPLPKSGKENMFASASVAARVEQFHNYLQDENTGAIIFARGGYGAVELLPSLDFPLIKKARKPIVGFSDPTVLLINISSRANLVCFHGAQVASTFSKVEEDDQCKASVDSLMKLLVGGKHSVPGKVLREGEGSGRVLAGNLTMLCSVLGTPWDVSYEDSILVIEEVSEAPYRVHRSLMQLLMAGKLEKLAGLCFGSVSGAEKAAESFFENYLQDFSYPVLAGLPVGHEDPNLPVPVGVIGKVSGEQLSFESASVSK